MVVVVVVGALAGTSTEGLVRTAGAVDDVVRGAVEVVVEGTVGSTVLLVSW